jgi:hypothetical protein
MGDTGDDYRAMDAAKRERRLAFGVDCPGCKVKVPKAHPTILMPQQRCRVCGYRDPRPSIWIREVSP